LASPARSPAPSSTSDRAAPIDPVHRRAALIATGVTLPLVVLIALAIGAATGTNGPDSTTNPTSGALPALSPSAPPHSATEATACNKVLEQLPVELGALAPRIVHARPDSPYVVAWGDPAVVLSCGVQRPKDLVPGSSAQFVAAGADTGPFYDVTRAGTANVFTTVDRAPYIAVVVPSKYQGGQVMPPLSAAIAKALPAVCSTDPAEPDVTKLCTRRP
jgi:hypothetical protein